MGQRKFKKAKGHLGKYLSIYVGNADKTISDTETLIGDKYAPFVSMGYLQEIKEEKAPPEASPSPAPEHKAPPEPKVVSTPAPLPPEPVKEPEVVEEPVEEPSKEVEEAPKEEAPEPVKDPEVITQPMSDGGGVTRSSLLKPRQPRRSSRRKGGKK